MERLVQERRSGVGRNGLRIWGLLFATAGILSRSILQRQVLGLGDLSSWELLEAMQTSSSVMGYATIALVLQALEACAIPIFAFLLTEGMKNTGNFPRYFLRVAGTAALSEVFYNWAVGGKLVDMSSWNPMFGLVVAMVAVYFFQRYGGKSFKNILIRVVVALSAMLWCAMLKITYGGAIVATVLTLWLFWNKPLWRTIAGTTVMLACSMFSLFLMIAPMSFLAVHSYNGEKGEENRVLNYLAYPILLLIAALVGLFFA